MTPDKKSKSNSEIIIDEDTHREAPSLFTRIKNGLISVFLGAIFAQVMLWVLSPISIVLLFDEPLFIMYLAACGVIGFIVGEKFIQTLGLKSTDWFDLLGRWK